MIKDALNLNVRKNNYPYLYIFLFDKHARTFATREKKAKKRPCRMSMFPLSINFIRLIIYSLINVPYVLFNDKYDLHVLS
jgi:hypothetical protein